MKKLLSTILILFVSVLLLTVSCAEKKQVDKRELAAQLVEEGKYRDAKQLLVTLRGQYPNDPKLIELATRTDENIAKELYEIYWEEAEEAGRYQDWIAAMIKIFRLL
jgi:predicted Zn-dependent protease